VGTFSKRSTSGIDEETVSKTAAPRKGVQSAILWCSAISSLCSSTAEQPVDNRQTVERHHAEGPLNYIERWMAQTDERRVEDPQRLARYQLQRPVLESSHELQLDERVADHKSAASPGDNSDGRAEARHHFLIAALM
jgi:hypothetical protein